jgi:hypothetical protein
MLASSPALAGEPNHVTTVKDEGGWRLQVDGEDTYVFGMNWGFVPIGTNYSYDFWSESDTFIEEALSREMTLLRDMGVNVIRLYPGIQPKWVEWIHDNYGIYVMINPLVGRYGTTIDGRFVPNTDYSDERTRQILIDETLAVVERYKDVRGVMFWLLGNEANYGLSWSSFEIENLPEGEQNTTRAVFLYSLYEEITKRIHATDTHHPVAIANGDLQYIDVIAEQMPSLDILGSNVYRGRSARDLYEEVERKLDLPIVYTEFGADAYNARRKKEDHLTQASYLLDQWQEIYEKSWGRGEEGNALGGFIFQWTDGWWKYKQEENLDVHDTTASWANRAYPDDFVEGGNNMNEEWFGITAKGKTDPRGHFQIYPRTAYYVLQQAFRLHPYDDEATLDLIEDHFQAIRPTDYSFRYEAATASRDVADLRRAFTIGGRVDFDTYTTTNSEAQGARPKDKLVFDHTESFYVDVALQPVDQLMAKFSVNVLANVADNPIDGIFWEARGRPADPDAGEDDIPITTLERVRMYNGSFEWNHKWFKLSGYFREGHFHWGYEGDYWNLYQEANYGDAIDIYAADVPFGFEFEGKEAIKGLRIAFGPQVFWGANPAIFAMYTRDIGPVRLSAGHQEDIAQQGAVTTSSAVPSQVTRKSTIYLGYERDNVKLDVGGLMAGTDRIGQTYRYTEDAADGEESFDGSGQHLLEDTIRFADTLGTRATLQVAGGPVQWLLEGAYQGRVSDAGVDARNRFTGWSVRGSGRGNHWHVQSGVMITAGNVTISPNILYQKPLVGPLAGRPDRVDPETGAYYAAHRARNILDDPFAVLDNRETLAGELLLTFDPTPGSWLWAWDNDMREDAVFAGSIGAVYRHQPTTTDANFGFTEDGIFFNFAAAPPAQDVWDVNARLIFNPGKQVKLVFLPYVGQAQSTGDDARLITRAGTEYRVLWRSLRFRGFLKFNDWGPYDFHRTFNLTFPVQVWADLSAGIGRPKPFLPSTRFGVGVKYRTRDEFSPDFVVDPFDPSLGWEFELRTYVSVTL